MSRPTPSLSAPSLVVMLAFIACNQPPGGQAVSIQPAEPTTVDDLVATLDELAQDENGDVLSYRWAWYRDGALLTELNSDTVPAARTAKGEAWTVEVTAFDGREVSPETAVANVTIANSAPTGTLDIIDDRVPTTEDIVAQVETVDLDEDVVDLEITWTRDGTAVDLDALRVPSSLTSKGEIWEITVVPTDGEDAGEAMTLAARIANSPPTALGAAITPTEVTESSELRCLSQGWRDPDGDEAGYRVSWVVNGTEIGAPGDTIDGEWFDKGDSVSCILTPWDGEDEGEPVTSEAVIVQNSPPEVRVASLDPSVATTSTDLTTVIGETFDADGDEVTVEVRWTVDGRAAGTGLTLPSSRISRGQQVSAEIIPSDGETAGTPFRLGPITVANTPPVATSVSVSPTTARTNDVLTATAAGTDADGDRVTFEYAWTVSGTRVPGSSATLEGSRWFDKGDTVSVTVTPSDSTDTGTPMTSSTLVIDNTPPTAPRALVTPSSPSASDSLRCLLTAGSSDVDGDSLTYRASWTRNGSSYTGASTTTLTGDTVPSSATRDGETWVCSLVASDGTDTSAAGTASVTVKSWKGKRTFSDCGASGLSGPSSSQCSSAYRGTALAGEVTVSGGKQIWTVPTTGTYIIEAFGAQGASAQSGRVGGRGARMRGEFSLTAGTRLTLVVGQAGTSDGCSGGGGGGSYVANGSTPLLVAAGGGGTRTSVSQNGCDGKSSRQAGTGSRSNSTWGCGSKSTSTIGAGGIVSASSWGSGGGAWSRDGAYEYNTNNRGRGFTNGSLGGGFSSTYRAYGGFGGGGAGNGSCGGGGGGGYSGGDGGRLAGGGGSYNSGSSQSNSTGARSGDGQITIDLK